MAAFFSDYNLLPFHLSLLALIILGLIEFIGHHFKYQPSQLIKHIIPSRLIDTPLLQVKFSRVLILVFLLMNFSVAGYFFQLCIYAQDLSFAPAYYIILPALILAIVFTVFMIHCLDQVIKPIKVIHPEINLVGRLATISSGNARPGFSAQACVRDENGHLHYVQIEPEFGELEFQSQIILIRRKKNHFVAKKIVRSNQLFNEEN